MRILVLSDTHGTLARTFDPATLEGVDLCVFCGDCLAEDFECLRGSGVPKIGVDGNHPVSPDGNRPLWEF